MTTFKLSTDRFINQFGDDIIQIKIENDITNWPRFKVVTGIAIIDFNNHIDRYVKALKSDIYHAGIDVEDSNFETIAQKIRNIM